MLVSGRVFMDIYFCTFHSAVPLFSTCNGDPRRMERLQADMQLRPKMHLGYSKNQRYPKCVLLCGSWMFDFMIKLIKWVVWFLLFIFFSLAWILIDRCQTNSQWYEVNLQNDFERFVLFCWWVLQACHDVCFFGDVWPLYDLKEVGWKRKVLPGW